MHDDVDLTETLFGLSDHVLDLSLVGHVGNHRQHVVRQLGGYLFEFDRIVVAQHDTNAFLDEQPSGRQAQATATAGDERHAPVDSQVHKGLSLVK